MRKMQTETAHRPQEACKNKGSQRYLWEMLIKALEMLKYKGTGSVGIL